jgi:hypothetical protein
MKEPQVVVATNYYSKAASVQNGPILLSAESDTGSNQFALTNTHCLGYGTVGPASLAFSTTVDEFAQGCLSGESAEKYAPEIPQRVIHLVRNPFDNLVERFFVTMAEADAVRKQKFTGRRTEDSSVTRSVIRTLVHQQDDLIGTTQDIPSFSLDPTGFRQYCRYLDEMHHFGALFNHSNGYDALPCRSEWYRYAFWHDLATQTYAQYQKAMANQASATGNRTQVARHLPFLALYYEDIFQMNDTMSSQSSGAVRPTGMETLLRFLNVTPPADYTTSASLSRMATIPTSRLPASDFFLTMKERKVAYQLVREVTGRQTWRLIKRYFPQDEYNGDMDTNMGSSSSYHELRLLSSIKPKKPPRYPAVSWLMSFPNSVRMLRPLSTFYNKALSSRDPNQFSFPLDQGTSYTIVNVEKMTNRTTGTNYGVGSSKYCVGVRPELDETGPFLRAPGTTLGPPNYVLTKTHCGGYCNDCSPDHFVRSLDTFESDCTRSHYCHAKDEYPKDVRRYPVEAVSSAVHLIRNPFDNLVARSHKGVKNLKKSAGWTDEEVAFYVVVAENTTNATNRARTHQEAAPSGTLRPLVSKTACRHHPD